MTVVAPFGRPVSLPVDVEAFDGPVVAASTWPAINVDGKRVGVLSNGPAAVRLVPELVRRAEVVKVFQRHAGTVLPALPLATRLESHRLGRRLGRWHLRLAVPDKELRRQLRPRMRIDTSVSSRWFRSLRQPNCELLSWPIAQVTPAGIRTADGVEHQLDLLIIA